MKYVTLVSEKLGELFEIDPTYIRLSIISIEILIAIMIVKYIIKKIYLRSNVSDRRKYFHNRNLQIILNTALVVMLVFLWSEQLQNIITFISFVSAGVAIAIRDIIFDFFAGIYIKVSKPFELEDRIEIGDVKGDVINTHALGFEILEIEERVNGEQSTGRIIHIPNSIIFEKPLKNYVKAFKYIWDEILVNVNMDADLEKTREIIYDILRNDEVLKTIPKKMENAIDDVTVDYRIYFNELEPIIYTQIKDGYIELTVRFLVNPRKTRDVENHINEKIIDEFRRGKIDLYLGKTEKV